MMKIMQQEGRKIYRSGMTWYEIQFVILVFKALLITTIQQRFDLKYLLFILVTISVSFTLEIF